MPLNFTLKNGYSGKFYVMYTVHTQKFCLTFGSKKMSENTMQVK